MIGISAVSTRAVGTAPKEIFVPATIVGTIVLTKIVGTAVPTIIVETAYYCKSCLPDMISMTSLGLPNLVSVTIGTRIFKKKFKKRGENDFF